MRAIPITASTILDCQNIAGWSVHGSDAVIYLYAAGEAGEAGSPPESPGDMEFVAAITASETQVFDRLISAPGGVFVDLVSGTLTKGVLYAV